MHIPYCLPIIKTKREDVLAVIKEHGEQYAYIEVWIDYVTDLDDAFVNELIDVLGEKLVLVLRRQQLDTIQMSLEKRCAIISLLHTSPILLDLDISQKEEIAYIQKNELVIRTILSFHNYEKTPDDGELLQVIDSMSLHQPTVYKIATYCQNQQDALRLLQLLLLMQKRKLTYIVLGMGEEGIITRIFGTLWGNKMIFTPLHLSESSAPGQLTKDQLAVILNTVKGVAYAR